MSKPSIFRQTLALILLLGMFLSVPGPISLSPTLEAASASATARLVAKLRKQIKSLKRQLATALLPAPVPPFIEMVTVGNPGNAADPSDGDTNTGGVQNFGAVPYVYQIGKYEVTNAQYAVFLNAVAATDTYSVYNTNMGSDARGGIDRFGVTGSYRYTVRSAMGDKPVNYVGFYDACRFCNWLHNGRPDGLQTAGTTEAGAYDLNITAVRSPGARFFLPSEDEWYKAAYHQPAAAGGDTDSYWLYPTRSNAIPTVATVDAIGEIINDTTNIANYNNGADWNGQNGNVTTVGSGGAGSASFYGAFDMGGNLTEWSERGDDLTRRLRGGSLEFIVSAVSSTGPYDYDPGNEVFYIGFRVASP